MNTKTVEIYSTPSCHFCHMAKEWLTAKGLPFVDYNVASDMEKRKEMVEMTGQMGVPVIKIEEEGHDPVVMVGFSEKLISEALHIA